MSNYASRYADAALSATLNANLGVGADSALEPNLRFERAIAFLAKRRFVHRGEQPSVHPIIFIQHPQGPASDLGRQSVHVPMIDNGLTEIGGHVWFINAAGSEAKGLALTDGDTDASLFDWIRGDDQLKDRPTVIIETRGGLFEMRSYTEGLASSDQVEVTDLRRKTISPADVKGALTGIWRKNLVSPGVITSPKTGPWQKASEHIPHREAELRIQTVLESGLKEHFKGFEVRHEQTQGTGRLDLEIEEPHEMDHSTVTRHILLELKVVRECTDGGNPISEKTNNDALTEGVLQAKTYRDERKVRAAALCCYDMRKKYRGDKALDHVRADAEEWGIDLWTWHLFGVPSDYRTYLEANGISA